jgi:hypothetical protein
MSTTPPSRVRTILDELLYETTKSSVDRANLANQNRNALPQSPIFQPDPLRLMREEMQHSAVAIVSAVTCLDTYLNSVFEDNIVSTGLRESLKGMGLVQKWYNAPSILGTTGRFDYDSSPMSDFRKIVGYRNQHIIHRKAIYIKPHTIYPLPDYEQINVINARLALTTLKNMITSLCAFRGTPSPVWVT